MVRAVLIEQNERTAADLADSITSVMADIAIVGCFNKIEDGLQYLHTNPVVDIIFSEVRVQDDFSFRIFDQTNICTPVIFVTAEADYMLKAFEYNCIAYILKPFDRERLKKAVEKYQMLYKKDFNNPADLNRHLEENRVRHIRHRMLVRKGKENISLPMSEIVLFHTENRTVYAIDKKGREYIVDKNLCDVELELDKKTFFRLNRQYIVNINFIHGYRAFEKVKLAVDLTLPKLGNHFLVVSQEMAPQFREWMYNA